MMAISASTTGKSGQSTRCFRRRRKTQVQPISLCERPPAPIRRSSRRLTIKSIDVIREHLGGCLHHGTGNPLAARAPTMPEQYAVRKLAEIINHGQLGRTLESGGSSQSSSTKSTISDAPSLKTERGKAGGSFWASRLRLAGAYGWTGIVLPPDADTTKPFPVDDSLWFLLESEDDRQLLQSIVNVERWKVVKDKVVTPTQLASLL